MVWKGTHKLELSTTKEHREKILKSLSNQYTPLLYEIRKSYWEKLQLDTVEGGKVYFDKETFGKIVPKGIPLLDGEIFIAKPEEIFYLKFPSSKLIEAGYVSKALEGASSYTDFLDKATNVIKEVTGVEEILWQSTDILSDTFQQMRAHFKQLSPTDEEFDASLRLENSPMLKLLKEISSLENVLMGKLVEMDMGEDLQERVNLLQKLGLIVKDFVVFCKQQGQQIFRVNNREAIDEASAKGFTCFLCGRPLAQERIEQLITLSDFGKKIMDNSYWMVVRVIKALKEYGIDNSQIYVEIGQEDSNDIFLVLNNKLIIIQTLDRKLRLEDAILFCAKLSVYKISAGVILTTQIIPQVMKSYIINASPKVNIKFIETFEELDDKISKLLNEWTVEAIIKEFSGFTSLTPVDISELILLSLETRLKGITEKKPAVETELPAESSEEPEKLEEEFLLEQ